MKKWISILLCLVLILTITGCGNTSSSGKPAGNQPAGVNDVLQQGMSEEDNKDNSSNQTAQSGGINIPQSTEKEETAAPEIPSKPDSVPASTLEPDDNPDIIDIDLTALSSTMVYSEVNNMMVAPDEYIGKTVKMKGPFAYYHDEAADNYYFACIIQDATACCSQGIEFVLAGDYTYPDDYPEVGTEICVVGVFDTYQEGDYTYCTLRNASLLSGKVA